MAAQCRNYMQQYSRTKSIRQINKNRNSYKQLLQNSKTRQNSSTTTNLRISDKKRSSQKQKQKQKAPNKNIEQYQIDNCVSVDPGKSVHLQEDVPLLSSTQNITNIINVSYGKLNSKMKLKVTAADKNVRSMSSQEQLIKYQNSVVVTSMADIGVGLSNKKKPKLVTLTSSHVPNSTSKKYRNHHQLTSISQHDQQHSHSNYKQNHDQSHQKSRSISKSHHQSTTNNNNSKYSTYLGHQAAYRSIKKEVQANGNNGNGNGNVEIITLNSSMMIGKDRKDRGDGLERVYDRVKVLLETNQQKQKQWQIQRNYYQSKIKQLQKQLMQANKKSMVQKSRTDSYSNYNSVIKEQMGSKSSNRNFN